MEEIFEISSICFNNNFSEYPHFRNRGGISYLGQVNYEKKMLQKIQRKSLAADF